MSKSVCFDFDHTLSKEHVQEYAVELISRGVDVWVLTSRYDELHKHLYTFNPTNEDLYTVVDKIGIPRHKVMFTNMNWKAEYLAGTHVTWLLDDNPEELIQIRNSKIKTVGIQVNSGSWKNKCERLLK